MTVALAMDPAPAAPPPCFLCGPDARTRRRRRLLCITCYRKLLDAGIALPPGDAPGPEGRSAEARIRAWVCALSPEHRGLLRGLIEDLEAAGGDP